ncbi:MAG: alpha/beta hydrolase [Gammaproteobacteria bacterium]|nr:alpha/beta hydrolase [Gammaproteobacteria bacterium]
MNINVKQNLVLLHGLGRTALAMSKIESAAQQAGYNVINIGYPSRRHTVHDLAHHYIYPKIHAAVASTSDSSEKINFITHSMGGILLRQMRHDKLIKNCGRVVMLAPPNQGSEVVDTIGKWWLFGLLYGQAGRSLGTAPDSVPNTLGAADFELGIITGNHSVNKLLSLCFKTENDGKVSVDRAKLSGMKDFLVLPVSHPFIMRDDKAIAQALHFIQHSYFLRE